MRPFDRDVTAGIRTRLKWGGVLLALGLAAVVTRAGFLQLGRGETLASYARSQYLRQLSMQPRRGTVTDIHGTSLAVSLESDSLFYDGVAGRSKKENRRDLEPVTDTQLEQLSTVLGLPPEVIRHKAAEPGRFTWLKRRMEPETAAAVRALKVKGLGWQTEFKRIYPQGELAAHVLGAVSIDQEGLEGVEQQLDGVLRGAPTAITGLKDVQGHLLIGDEEARVPYPTGATVQLTLDAGLQMAAEKALAEAVEKTRAAGAMALVMDPNTGALLALANWPTFDPNRPGEAAGGVSARRNLAVVNMYEPGSTMKCFLMAAALSEQLITPETIFDVSGGVMQIGSRRIRDSHPPHTSTETTTQILATSSNVGCARVGLKLGAERLISWYKAFGFGERTGLGLDGEARGRLQRPKVMGEIGTATSAFGQGVSVTPLQMVTALSAIANGGRLLKPWLVNKVTAADGKVLLQGSVQEVRRVLTPEVARTTTRMMTAVVAPGGSGTHAAVPGFVVAGKTGTAQKADPVTHGYGSKRFGSFMGFVPAYRPQVAIYVAIDEPKGEVYGGLVAAPVFKQIAVSALQQRAIPPDEPELLAAAGQTGRKPGAPEPKAAAKTTAPVDDSRVIEGFIDDGQVPAELAGASGLVMPDLKGLSVRAALRLLGERSLAADVEGSGRTVSQDPAAGALVAPGTRVHLQLGGG